MTCKDCLHFVPCGGASWEKVTDCPEENDTQKGSFREKKPKKHLRKGSENEITICAKKEI